MGAPIRMYYFAVAGDHASVAGPEGKLATLLDTQVRHDMESAHPTLWKFTVRLCTALEKLPPIDGPARSFVEHPPAGDGPGRHERRIPLRLGDPSTVHHFDGSGPRTANDFEWDPHHALASPRKSLCDDGTPYPRLAKSLSLSLVWCSMALTPPRVMPLT